MGRLPRTECTYLPTYLFQDIMKMKWSYKRRYCRNTCGKRTLRKCGTLHSRWFEQCESLLSLAYVVLHACE